MNLNHLALFVAVAEEGSVTRGAARLRVSQPAVSRQVRELEAELGVALLDRVGRGVRLTDTGSTLLGYARRLFAVEAEAHRALADARDLSGGRFTVGASTTIGEYLLPPLLAAFHQTYPGVTLHLKIGNTDDIQSELRGGAVDLALTEGFADAPDLSAETFMEDELVVIVAPGHPLAEETGVSLETLAACESLILRELGSGTRAVLESALAARGLLVPYAVMTLAGTEAIKRVVGAGAGVGVVSSLTVGDERKAGRLVALPVSGEPLRRPLHRLRLKGKSESRAVSAFLRLLPSFTPLLPSKKP